MRPEQVARRYGAPPRVGVPKRGVPRRPRRRVPRQDNGGGGILLVGILGLFLCGILAVVAWFSGSSYERSCRARGMTPGAMGTAGKIVGMLGTALWAFGFILTLFGQFAHLAYA